MRTILVLNVVYSMIVLRIYNLTVVLIDKAKKKTHGYYLVGYPSLLVSCLFKAGEPFYIGFESS